MKTFRAISRATISCAVSFTLLSQIGVQTSAFTLRSTAHVTPQSERRPAASRRTPSRRLRRPKSGDTRQRKPDVIFVPTPPETVNEMLRLARIRKGDVLYDLGSGDGRIPVAAAQQYGIRAVGLDIDASLVAEATRRARQAGVADLAVFRREDLFKADFREATVVTLYLSDSLNLRLRPKLLRELRPGTRIISHDFRMGDWKPEQTVRVPWRNLHRTIYVWTVSARGRERSK